MQRETTDHPRHLVLSILPNDLTPAIEWVCCDDSREHVDRTELMMLHRETRTRANRKEVAQQTGSMCLITVKSEKTSAVNSTLVRVVARGHERHRLCLNIEVLGQVAALEQSLIAAHLAVGDRPAFSAAAAGSRHTRGARDRSWSFTASSSCPCSRQCVAVSETIRQTIK